MIFFFFSSRRRHTRWTGDWSSDVCSSDLPWAGTTDRDVECLLGAAMLCRTEQVRALGGFDESVPLYLDDMDLCKRLGDLGRLRYLSGTTILHHYSLSTTQLASALTRRLGLRATDSY